MTIPFRITSGSQFALTKPSTTKDVRLWIGVVLILLASITGGKVLASASHRIPAVVVIRDLTAGSLVTASDIQIMNVAIPTGINAVSTIEDVVGKYVTQDIAQGSLLNPHIVDTNADPTLRTISVPIKAGHLPNVATGARVDVWFTPSMDGAAAPGPASLLASNVAVQSVPEIFDSAIDTAIALRVDEDVVALLVQALRDGTVDIAVIEAGTNG